MNVSIFDRTPRIEQVLSRLKDPEHFYTTEKGRVVSMDSIEVAHVGNAHGRFESIHNAVSLDNGQTQTLVLFNRPVTLTLDRGDELWVAGRHEAAGRFRAMVVVSPSLQLYADLTTDSSFIRSYRFHVLISALIGLVGLMVLPAQYITGMGLLYLSMFLFSTGLYLKYACGAREVNATRASTREWRIIGSAFGRTT